MHAHTSHGTCSGDQRGQQAKRSQKQHSTKQHKLPDLALSQTATYQESGRGQKLPEQLEEIVPEDTLTADHHLNVLYEAVST